MSLLLSACQRLHAIATVGFPNYLKDRATFVGDKEYILQVIAHFEKYHWTEQLSEAINDYVRSRKKARTWTVTVVPSILQPGTALFKFKGDDGSTLSIRIRKAL
ncbi:hypothetical protein [Pseudomonas aeruginosa]|uniref:Uncharacterized protein n=1 Tax=Pseudomonas phage vB_PaeM_PS119XW TaxID=2601632 RepID=A0A5C1K810_9CAUD|nr:hypothetical protein [Pseudomonas aeruginosa]YP_010661031.1 hypothetical protein PP933_gp291 [Pseudomonas phage vB_PaeM_PS119XW]QBX32448.1 hypothetical protein [Pseudomonas phage PA1C]BEG72535.1 hypothetical protein RVBP21_1630 [Pseudomonas phage BRkr]MBW6072492.1 hypothetical protein [Pseudomonas aeruginosa]QEM42020.1 hypothetical protein [Pseudomonas phage vB_PaeM_PS119XW]